QLEELVLPAEARAGDARSRLVGAELDALDERLLAGEPRKVERLHTQLALGRSALRPLAIDRDPHLALRSPRVARRLPQERGDAASLQRAGEARADELVCHSGAEHGVARRVLDREAPQLEPTRLPGERKPDLRPAFRLDARLDLQRPLRLPAMRC